LPNSDATVFLLSTLTSRQAQMIPDYSFDLYFPSDRVDEAVRAIAAM